MRSRNEIEFWRLVRDEGGQRRTKAKMWSRLGAARLDAARATRHTHDKGTVRNGALDRKGGESSSGEAAPWTGRPVVASTRGVLVVMLRRAGNGTERQQRGCRGGDKPFYHL